MIPEEYDLLQNYPKPFNPQTTIPFRLPRAGRVTIRVVDIRGKAVRTLLDGHKEPGHHTISWDGRDDRGMRLSSGIYFVQIRAEGFVRQRKMLLLQ